MLNPGESFRGRHASSIPIMTRESDRRTEDVAAPTPGTSVEETVSRVRRVIESTEERIDETRKAIVQVRRILAAHRPDEA